MLVYSLQCEFHAIIHSRTIRQFIAVRAHSQTELTESNQVDSNAMRENRQ